MPANFGPYQPFTGFSIVDPNTNVAQDLGQRYITKSYLLDTYPNIASATGSRTSPGLWAWGTDGYGAGSLGNGVFNVYYSSPIQIGSLPNWKQVINCDSHTTAAVKTDGTLWTWGYNGYGQLGNGTVTIYNSPIQVGTGTNWKQVAGGQYYTMAIKTDGTLWAWGVNGNGQLGNGTIMNYSSPIQITSTIPWKQVVCGANYTAAVKTDGTLWAWGNNFSGQLGNSTTINYSSPVQIGVGTNWKQIACGYHVYNTVAIKQDGTMWSWGDNSSGQLGINIPAVSYSSPVQVGTQTTWKQVDVDTAFMAVKTDGTLWACGANGGWFGAKFSSFAFTTVPQSPNPSQFCGYTSAIWSVVDPDTTLLTINGGTSYSSATAVISKDNSLWTCGYNNNGQLGNSTPGFSYSSPVQVGTLTNWKQASAGAFHTASVKLDGSLWIWGDNYYGQLGGVTTYGLITASSPIQVGSSTTWSTVSSSGLGASHSAIIKQDGTLWTWGYNSQGQLGNNTTISYSSPIQVGSGTNWNQVACAYGHTVAIRTNGTLWAWGSNTVGQLGNNTNSTWYSSPIQIGVSTNWKQVACSSLSGNRNPFTAAVKTDGTLWAWGNNLTGQLGNNTTINYSSPVQIGSLTNWKQVACGYAHTAAIKTDGTLWTWGSNSGQLGNGTTVSYSSPIQIGTLTNWKQVSGGTNHTTAIKTDGTLWSWGDNGYGQLGNGTLINYSSPIQISSLTPWAQVIAGDCRTIAIQTDGSAWAWGANDYFSGNPLQSVPIQIDASTNWSQLSLGVAHAIAVKADNSLWAWGNDVYGQLGTLVLGNPSQTSSPIQVGSLATWKQVCCGRSVTAAIGINGSLWMWGDNYYGQLGNNIQRIRYSSPIQVGSGTNWKQVACGYGHTVAIKTDGTLWAWGDNYAETGGTGQLGNGTALNYSSPVQVGSGTNWKQVSAGSWHTAAVKTDGTLWTWGYNSNGQLGNNDLYNNPQSSPVQVGTGTNWKQVAACGYHTLAVKTDGTLWSWGANHYGQLGNGTFIDSPSPIQVGSSTYWTQVFGGFVNSFGYTINNVVWAWGNNNGGQLGTQTSTPQVYSSPIQIGSLTNWKTISIKGANSAAAIKTDGTLWTWGSNNVGQLGYSPVGIYVSSPTQVGTLTTWRQISNGPNNIFGISDGYI